VKLTLASYAAGPGCLAEALKAAKRQGEGVSWDSVSGQFSAECAHASTYVDHIVR
jgi:hypothetical protein